MSIITESDRLSKSLEDLGESGKRREKNTKLSELLNDVGLALKETKDIKETSKSIRKSLDKSDTEGILTVINQIKSLENKDYNELVAKWGVVKSEINARIHKCRLNITTKWHEHIDAEFPDIKFYELFKSFDGAKVIIKKLNEIKSKVDELRPEFPVKQEHIRKLEQLVAEVNLKKQELDLDDVDPEVLKFLKKCGDGSARLSELTSEVREWLDKKKFSKNLIIKPYERFYN